MAEISRLATIDADHKKSDFIGSISHELRSPLHGVLASAEFLAGTELDAFQSSLIWTIERYVRRQRGHTFIYHQVFLTSLYSCGQTLLDTINHVLDFSRINTFEKTWRRTRKLKKGKQNSLQESDKGGTPLPGLLSIFCRTDIAAITGKLTSHINI